MVEHVFSSAWQEGIEQMIQAQKDYREAFGEGALDYVILGEPIPEKLTDLSDATKKLRDSIRTGVPLKNTPPNPDMPEIIY
ncbi:hypothetical protein [Negativicoccus succinicivorans]|uniref:hypothetical protein n=1 Tax=Negativicoccus succinicivorans TaxID=620903 RepID=UPI002901B354|nr:hypothetical protein [Negativicoccus succinicivorans]MDU2418060.1 hypothetical protein [Negativicoccus succinicivorans]